MRLRHTLAACLLVATVALPGALGTASAVGADAAPKVPPASDCPDNGRPTAPQATVPWYESQLNFTGLSQVNQGRYVQSGTFDGRHFAAGDPVTVAVIDSGLTTAGTNGSPNPIFAGADTTKVYQVQRWRLPDCVGHGTAVASLIVGQPGRSRLVGIAPQVHLVPIQYTHQENGGTAADLEAALAHAIALHPRVINLSLQLPNPPVQGILDELKLAQRDHIVIVAAGGNDDQQTTGAVYPAALSPELDNIIAVSAVGRNGVAASFGITGSYIDVAAPGVEVPVAVRYGGATVMSGTSFAAPLVTGTVALMLATHPDMLPSQVRTRLEATAAPPPGNQPNAQYGWGAIDPLAAITSQRNDLVTAPSPSPGAPLAAPRPAAAPNRTLEHRALAAAFVLLGLAALTVTGAAVLRGRRTAPARRG